MPVRRGYVTPQNTFFDTIIRKSECMNKNFLIANARTEHSGIIYCNDGFCDLTGFSRAEVMQKSCRVEFLYGQNTNPQVVQQLCTAVEEQKDIVVELLLYKKDGSGFLCQVCVTPVRNEQDEIAMFILNFEDTTNTHSTRTGSQKWQLLRSTVKVGSQLKFLKPLASQLQRKPTAEGDLNQEKEGPDGAAEESQSNPTQGQKVSAVSHTSNAPKEPLLETTKKSTEITTVPDRESNNRDQPEDLNGQRQVTRSDLDKRGPNERNTNTCDLSLPQKLEGSGSPRKHASSVVPRVEFKGPSVNSSCEDASDTPEHFQLQKKKKPRPPKKMPVNRTRSHSPDSYSNEEETQGEQRQSLLAADQEMLPNGPRRPSFRLGISSESINKLTASLNDLRKSIHDEDPLSAVLNMEDPLDPDLAGNPSFVRSIKDQIGAKITQIMKHTVSTPTDEHGQSIVRGDNRSRRAGSSSSSSSEESMSKEDERIKQYNALAAARRRATTIAAKSDHPGEAGDGTGAEDAPHKAVRFTRARLDEVLSLGTEVIPEYKMQSRPRMHRWTVLHYSPFKAMWDWIILLLVIYTAIFTPYVAAFVLSDEEYLMKNQKAHSYGKSRYDDPLVIIDLLVDVMFIIDILINFRTTYVNKNEEVISEPSRIAVHYFKGWFLIDVVAAIPFDLLMFGTEEDETTTLIGLLKTARLLRLVRVARKLDRYSEYGAAVLLLLMCTFAMIAHWLACIWYAIANVERPTLEHKIGWLDHLSEQINEPFNNSTGLGGPSTKAKYITALYFTFSSITSVGFGNVSPNTNAEKIFSIMVMLVGSLMYASIFGNVSAIIQRLYSGTARYHTQMLRVKEFIKFHQIPNPLKQRLEEYFQHAWTYTNGIDMHAVLKGFPDCLQAEICMHLNRNLLKGCAAFKDASPGCLRALSIKFKTTHIPPGDTLVHKGDVLSSLYFIARGSVEISEDEVVVAILSKDDIFGDGEAFCDNKSIGKSRCVVNALTYCDLHKIEYDDIAEVLDIYPEFKEQFRKNLEVTFSLRDNDMVLLNDLFEDFQGAPLSWSPPSLNMGKENKQPVLFQPPFASDGDEDDSPMTYGIRILMSLKAIQMPTRLKSKTKGEVLQGVT
ncbi:potassium voltage-gated channel subfamily H member 6-like [Symsagittifera roscoffensis]|uniref:potassium voltage-gated channel subfamily H member 6-like n=1 Tax=Symsagittifera roscoffensis TaxID=84072 RepID=UPI00307BF880